MFVSGCMSSLYTACFPRMHRRHDLCGTWGRCPEPSCDIFTWIKSQHHHVNERLLYASEPPVNVLCLVGRAHSRTATIELTTRKTATGPRFNTEQSNDTASKHTPSQSDHLTESHFLCVLGRTPQDGTAFANLGLGFFAARIWILVNQRTSASLLDRDTWQTNGLGLLIRL